MAASGESERSGGRPLEGIAGHAVVGSGALGPVVRDGDGRLLNALLLSQERAEGALGSGIERLAPHEHRQRLVDVGVHAHGAVLLTTPAVVSTLEQVLESGAVLPPGVVVTLLAPVVGALQDAAAAGVHPLPGAEAIGLTEEGRPVLLLTEASTGSTEADVVAAVIGLLGRCRRSCPAWRGSPRDDDDLAALEALLYRSAAPLPLRAAQRPETAAGWERPTGVVESPPARHRRTHPLDGWRDRVRTSAVRRRGLLVTAAVVLVGALVMTGLGPDRSTGAETAASTRAPAPAPAPVPSTRTPAPSPVAPTRPVPATATATAPATAGGTPPPPVRAVATPTRAPAPAPSSAGPTVRPPGAELGAEEAATALLAAARHCGGSDSACAEALTTPDSPIRVDGGSAFAALRTPASAVTAVRVDVNGASAVVAVGPDPGTTTASVLMIRTEAAWLLRDVFTDGGR
ncbi:hypothetical protein EDF54_1628 [Rathayibacter sp. PhB93]|uniref:hypothetical protein n=1 Tax=unclassified Rathayibacter TaxID=2609250 RepID=UPI000FA5D1B3|nr:MULTISPECIES: hypothetical protein [unclassified Rathayibacter]ROQ06660.1 hypothetical protein EDF54_1628 [Rathayibacter sp. PhB93]TDQ14417.1 hypothetical protein EDF17_1447 [Rathayibacter sp. PhB1]